MHLREVLSGTKRDWSHQTFTFSEFLGYVFFFKHSYAFIIFCSLAKTTIGL